MHFWGLFLDQGGLSFCHLFGYICFLSVSLHLDSQPVMDGKDF